MNLSKLSSIVKSQYNHQDILGNTICIGDIVVVANKFREIQLGVVHKISNKYISIYDKELLEEGETVTLGRGVTGDQILVVNKLFSNDMQKVIEENKDNVINQKKLEKKNNPLPRYVLTFLYKNENDYGIYVLKCKKIGLKYLNEAVSLLKEKYNDYQIFYYSSGRNEFINEIIFKDITFFSSTAVIFTNSLNSNILYNKFIKLYNYNNRYNFCIKIDEYNKIIEQYPYSNHESIFSDIIKDYKTINVVNKKSWGYEYSLLFTYNAHFNDEKNFIKIIDKVLQNIK